jgi:hypothetical protein
VVVIARLCRWLPFAWGGKNPPSTVEQLRKVQQAGEPVTAPKRTQDANWRIRHSRLKAELERKRA